MPRTPMDVGTHGTVRFVATATGYRARARYRGYDGVIRDASGSGASRTKAERAVKKAVADALRTPVGGELSPRTRFCEAAEQWLEIQQERVIAGERATGTLDNYRSMLRNHVLPAFGELRLNEVSIPRLDRFFPTLARKTSAAHARTARAVVSGVLRHAVRNGALTANPVREVEAIEGGSRKKVRALTRTERKEWLAQLEADPVAVAKDLPDLTRFMLATGVRIGEALALYWEDVDLIAPAVVIEWTVVRVRGEGLRRTDPKSASGERTLSLPEWAAAMLRERQRIAVSENRAGAHPVFPDTLGGLRDPSNTRRALREARGSDGFAWVTSHVFRKTAATILDNARLTAREIADQLGHSKPSMTQDVYMGRGEISPAAAAALEDIM
ncbi:site-specific integrase [Amycolatopsis antarctica]|uniref:Site-specific integrase n=1 Tax=Amycolatopsis antarctica TaxID=1854586 RepID=A0A263D557_9PSEU|nr:site-specific integrase [Amycolatopsis antarctica]